MFKVVGKKFSEDCRFYDWDTDKIFPVYDEVDERVWNISASSLDEAKKWVLENYPEYFMGCSITNGKDFLLAACPGLDYPVGYFETLEGRVAYAKSVLKDKFQCC